MFTQTISPLQLYKPRTMDGLIEENRLINAFQTQPVEMSGVLAYMFATNPGKSGNIMNLLTTYMGNTEYITDPRYRWKLYTGSKRIIDIAGPHIDGGLYPGMGNSAFRVPLAEPFFEDGDVVLLDDNVTQLRVMGDHVADGETYIYTFKIMTEDPKAYVLPQYVDAGARMSKEYNVQPEYSDRGSGVSMNTGIELQNRLGIFRKTISITRSAQTDVMAVDLMTADGKKTRVWDTAASWQAAYEFAQEVDTALFYGKLMDSGKMTAANGRPIFQGAGFRAQIAPSNRWEYSTLTYDYIDNFFTDLSYNATANGGSRSFVVLTGQQGMREVNKVLSDQFKSNAYLLTDSSKFLGGSGDDLQLQGHFSRVKLMNGVEVAWKLFEPYDDRYRNRLIDPKTGYPYESSRHTVMNIGSTGDGKANIQKIVKKDSLGVTWEVGGSVTAQGTRKGGQGASGKDGRDVHWLEDSGLKLNDPTSCGELVKTGTPLS